MNRIAWTLAAVTLLLGLSGPVGAQILPGYQGDYDAAKAQFRSYALGEFQDVLNEWTDAIETGDAARAARLYDDNAYLQLAEPAVGTAAIESALSRWVEDLEGIQSGLADFDASGSLSYGTVRLILQGTAPRTDGQGTMLIVMRRHGGDWKIRAQTLVLSDD